MKKFMAYIKFKNFKIIYIVSLLLLEGGPLCSGKKDWIARKKFWKFYFRSLWVVWRPNSLAVPIRPENPGYPVLPESHGMLRKLHLSIPSAHSFSQAPMPNQMRAAFDFQVSLRPKQEHCLFPLRSCLFTTNVTNPFWKMAEQVTIIHSKEGKCMHTHILAGMPPPFSCHVGRLLLWCCPKAIATPCKWL